MGMAAVPMPDTLILTPRQHDALCALVKHGTYQLAAHALDMSVRTFEVHMQGVARRAGNVHVALVALGAGRIVVRDMSGRRGAQVDGGEAVGVDA
jgi:DNA-binding CsgD family transcriptional regulator